MTSGRAGNGVPGRPGSGSKEKECFNIVDENLEKEKTCIKP